MRLGHVSHLFRQGHRVRLHVASSNFPRFDRNPQSAVATTLAGPGDLAVARQTVLGGPTRRSHLILPVVAQRSLGALSLAAAGTL